ncbi:MAG: DUF177 domain-containing protein [Candidatus Poribacteria bacterium]|nr:DUF177 domain-containing protein [Candidatus Poribacteria bacterium]
MKTLEFIVQKLPEGQLDRHEVMVLPADIDLELEDVRFIGFIHGGLQLLRQGQDVYATGNFSASIELPCRRCGESFETHFEAEIEIQFYPTDEAPPTDSVLMDTGERYYSGSTIDLSEDVRQVVVLETPTWLLCSESCKGLCTQCGENLNVTDCGCHIAEEKFSPFAALADLFNESDHAVGNGSEDLKNRQQAKLYG